MPTRRGSTATIFMPPLRAATISWARINEVELGLWPQSKNVPLCATSGVGISTPKVYVNPVSLCQLQTWVVETQLGLPKLLRKRESQRSASETDVPPPVPLASATERAPSRLRISISFAAISSSA